MYYFQWQEHLSISHIIAVIIANNTSKMNYFVYYLLLELKFIFFKIKIMKSIKNILQ